MAYLSIQGRKQIAGVVITNRRKVLAIVPYGKPYELDLPKGHMEEGETSEQGALRELYEETGIKLQPNKIFYLGSFPLSKYKDLHLYLHLTEHLPPTKYLKCNSYFENDWGKDVPEAIDYEYVDFDDNRFYGSLKTILRELGKQLRKW